MNLTEAARATRKYFVTDSGEIALTVDVIRRDRAEAQSACDRLNLAAVLEAIREPSEDMVLAAPDFAARTDVAALADAVLALVERVRELEAPSQAVITEEWLDFRTAPDESAAR